MSPTALRRAVVDLEDYGAAYLHTSADARDVRALAIRSGIPALMARIPGLDFGWRVVKAPSRVTP